MTPNPATDRLPRLWRLTLKELREILRDRRTIVTLVLMPLLLYPLLSVAFQQFFASQLAARSPGQYIIGFRNDAEGQFLTFVLAQGGLSIRDVTDQSAGVSGSAGETEKQIVVEAGVRPELERGLEEYDIHVGLRYVRDTPDQFVPHFDPTHDLALDLELLYLPESTRSREAAALVEKHLQAANERFLGRRLNILKVSQRPVPIRFARKAVEEPATVSGIVSITAVVPFILILMTVAGAVYPAIDLTAGERERGTLEVLIAAPIPRIGVLFAKYVAVLSVALLTAAANLLTMTITIASSGLGKLLFGEAGLSPGVISAIFGLLLLFAAFFSAVLLVITSSARSFKEAQAYLIPLMIVALAPGMLGLKPDLELSGLWLVTPLANIVLLGRDLFALKASGAAAAIVVISTLLYAGAAISLAARIFGAESVLYSSQSGWADLFRRPSESRPAPTLSAAVLCLAMMFPAYFLLINLIGGEARGVAGQLTLGVIVTAVVFGGLPLATSWFGRIDVREAFGFRPPAPFALVGALLLGLSLWTFDHELVIASMKWRGVSLTGELLEKVRAYVATLRDLSPFAVVFALAIVPAVFEEAFFRGFLFSAVCERASLVATVLTTALVFGLFHVITPNPLASERFLSSTALGIILACIRSRTGSIVPGMLLHTCHNGFLVLLLYFEPQFSAAGVAQGEHLPNLWLIIALAQIAAGSLLLISFGRRPPSPSAL